MISLEKRSVLQNIPVMLTGSSHSHPKIQAALWHQTLEGNNGS